MTATKQKEVVTPDGRLKLTVLQAGSHYSIVALLLVIPGLTAYDIYQIYVTHTYDGVRPAGELLNFSLPFFFLAIILYFVQRNKLKFRKIDVTITDEVYHQALGISIAELNWRVEHSGADYFRAHRPWGWSASFGEMITIVKRKDHLLINSICDPDERTAVVSWGWNRKNIEVFLNHLVAIVKKQNGYT